MGQEPCSRAEHRHDDSEIRRLHQGIGAAVPFSVTALVAELRGLGGQVEGEPGAGEVLCRALRTAAGLASTVGLLLGIVHRLPPRTSGVVPWSATLILAQSPPLAGRSASAKQPPCYT